MLNPGFAIIIAVLARVLSNPVSNVFQKKLSRGQHPLFINLVTYLLLSIAGIILASGYDIGALRFEFWLYSILGGLTGALGNGFIIKALEKGDLSVLGPINAYKSIVGAVFAFFLIGEIPNAWGFAGMALIIAGSYFVLNTSSGKFNWSVFGEPAIRYRIAALVFTGIEAVFDKKVIQHSNLTLAFASWSVFGFLFSWIIFQTVSVRTKEEMEKMSKDSIIKYLALAGSVTIMIFSTNYTFSHMPVGEALALFQLSILVSVFFGFHFFSEKNLLRKLLGSVIMIIGSLLIIFFK